MRQPERRKGVIESEGGCRPERGLECRPRLGAIPAGGLFAARQSLSENVKEVNDVESKKKFFKVSVFCLSLLSIILCFSMAFGAIINVPEEYESIQGAIDAAVDGDTVLVAEGIYTGEENKNLDLLGKAITVKSENGPEACIIDCEGNGRGFYFHSNEGHNSVVSGFTIKRGSIGLGPPANGEAQGGHAAGAAGAGILIEDCSPTIEDCIISECEVIGYGGGIAVLGDPDSSPSSPIISDCVISDNEAHLSEEEESGGRGGGLALHDNASPVVKRCIIRDNRAQKGGGVSLDSEAEETVSPSLSNCVITANTAEDDGGAVNAEGNTAPAITNCTISRNEARGEVGGRDIVLDTDSSAVIVNSIIYDERVGSVEEIVFREDSLPVVAYSNIQVELPEEIADVGNISEDPLFVDPDGDNRDFSLHLLSPCIDKATPAMAKEKDVDARERKRGFAPEMGAHENETGPEAKFISDTAAGPVPLEVSFTDDSTEDAILRSWDFGDGVTSTERDPIHTYDTPGTYTVELVVIGPEGINTETKTGHIVVGETAQSPEAAFSGTPISGPAQLDVAFTDESTGDITGWLWDFGDDATSTLQNPSHTYDTPGTYQVRLTVTGPGGQDTETKANYIEVSEPAQAPEAAFTGAPTSGKARLTVDFTDQSTGDITSWQWDFGDGATSTEQNPSHTYRRAGTYTVTLTVSGPGGSDTETETDYITVKPWWYWW